MQSDKEPYDMLMHLLLLIAGLGLLLAGGELIVRGASALARALGVPPLVIGLTIVAFGTSAPELSVNLTAAVEGNADLSFGNIIGSNIANTALIVGVAALIRPLAIHAIIISREIPMMILASIIALITGMDAWIRSSDSAFDRSDGLVFLMLFCVFMFYTIGDVIYKRGPDNGFSQADDPTGKKDPFHMVGYFLIFIIGLALLVFGGKTAVNGAVGVAEWFQVPKIIIGLTIIAVGTSLPELVTSVMATLRGQTDIAVGNIVGSNIFNLLFINGICATFKPIPVPTGGEKDLLMMVFLSFFLLPLCITNRKMILRKEGLLLLALYFGFNLWRVMTG